MPSPFPGMNPFLEHPSVFHDFHGALAYAIRDALVEQIAPRFLVKVDEHVYIHEFSAEERRLLGKPDVGIKWNPSMSEASGPSTAMLDSPTKIEHNLAIDEMREKYLTILDGQSRDVVTVIELLSPSNKLPGPDREVYLSKRQQILRSSTNLVEFDLLRAGPRMPDLNIPRNDYVIVVSRPALRPSADCWSFSVQDPFPAFPIPLRLKGDEVVLNVKSILDRVYDAAGYQFEIYANPLQPSLSSRDAAWSQQLLRDVGVTISI